MKSPAETHQMALKMQAEFKEALKGVCVPEEKDTGYFQRKYHDEPAELFEAKYRVEQEQRELRVAQIAHSMRAPVLEPIPLSEMPVIEATGGTKHDGGKSAMSLIPQDVLLDVGEVLEFGARKYQQWNWTKGFPYTRLASAVMRHLAQWLSGQNKDPESGKSHLVHALCGLLMLAAHEKRGLGVDDRDTTYSTKGGPV